MLLSCLVRGDDVDEYDLKRQGGQKGGKRLGERIMILNHEKYNKKQ